MRLTTIAIIFVLLMPFAYGKTAVITNKFDKRNFEYLELSNQLKVLLISDKKATKAAVALDVFVGSGEDPLSRQGMAHFLEHMLFLGTAKYPKVNDFQDFVQGHGGRHNANTSLTHTNFFFDIEPLQLESALDRFSQFFISPLFDITYIKREKNAVHAEFTSKLDLEEFRRDDVFRELVATAHPLSRFTTGNKDTLGSVSPQTLREELVYFYEKHYKAHRMALVVSGPQDLITLKQLVRKKFSRIRVRQSTDLVAHYPSLFDDAFLPAEVHIEPKKNIRTLSLVFPVPSTKPYAKEKPLSFIGHFLGHEGKGSLLALFKEKKWANALHSGGGRKWRGGETFTIDIYLTALGQKNVNAMTQLLFDYIELLLNEGVRKWRFQELADISRLSFDYRGQGNTVNEVSRLARLLHEVAAEHVYWRPYDFENYNPHTIKHYLRLLNQTRVLKILTAPGLATDRVSQYYGTPYKVLQSGGHETMKPVEEDALRELKKQLFLPKKNAFIPQDLKIYKASFAAAKKTEPKLVYDKNAVGGWYLNDNIFDLPRGQIRAEYVLPRVAESVADYIALNLYISILEESLNQVNYDAKVAGLNYSLNTGPRGLVVSFTGYNDSLSELFNTVTKRLNRFGKDKVYSRGLADRYFEAHKTAQLRQLRNLKFNHAYTQLYRVMALLLHTPYWSDEDLIRATERMQKDDFLKRITTLFEGGRCNALVFGNFKKREAKRYFSQFSRRLPRQNKTVRAVGRVVKIPSDKQFAKFIDVESKDSVSALYIQGRTDSLKEQARFGLLEKLVDARFYHSLRTVQQLGYIVFASNYSLRNVPGLALLVQSPSEDAIRLHKKTREFLSQKKATIFQSFERDKQGLLVTLNQPFNNQQQWFNYYWTAISKQDADFSWKKHYIDATRSLTKENLSEMYDELLLDNNGGVIILTSSKGESLQQLGSTVVEIESDIQFKKSMPEYTYH